jgi:hypothetical protein
MDPNHQDEWSHYLTEALQDPSFHAAYIYAYWVDATRWRRFLNRHRWTCGWQRQRYERRNSQPTVHGPTKS